MKRAGPVVIRPAVRAALLAHARRERPAECCGFLLGAGNRVEFAVAMTNTAGGSTRFRIDPAAHIELRRVVRRFAPALEIVGVYHSHPAGRATPSPTDLAEAHYPEWAYLVIGLGTNPPRIRAFRLAGARLRPVPIRWRAGSPGL